MIQHAQNGWEPLVYYTSLSARQKQSDNNTPKDSCGHCICYYHWPVQEFVVNCLRIGAVVAIQQKVEEPYKCHLLPFCFGLVWWEISCLEATHPSWLFATVLLVGGGGPSSCGHWHWSVSSMLCEFCNGLWPICMPWPELWWLLWIAAKNHQLLAGFLF